MLAVGKLHGVVEEITPLFREGLVCTCFPALNHLCRTHSASPLDFLDRSTDTGWFRVNREGLSPRRRMDRQPIVRSRAFWDADSAVLRAHEDDVRPIVRMTDPP